MYAFEHSVFINRPQQEVFDFVSNPANDPLWTGSIESCEITSEGPVGVGSTKSTVAKFMGRKIESTSELTAWDPPNQFGNKTVSGPTPFEVTFTFTSKENGTQLVMGGQADAGGFFKLAEGLVGKQLDKQLDNDLNALKLLLEAG